MFSKGGGIPLAPAPASATPSAGPQAPARNSPAAVILTLVEGKDPGPLFIIVFASSGISHARTFTSFECSLSETPPLRKET